MIAITIFIDSFPVEPSRAAGQSDGKEQNQMPCQIGEIR
jgi:hypothetical protein